MKVHSGTMDFLDTNVRKTGCRAELADTGIIIKVDRTLSPSISQFPKRSPEPVLAGKRNDGKTLDQRPERFQEGLRIGHIVHDSHDNGEVVRFRGNPRKHPLD